MKKRNLIILTILVVIGIIFCAYLMISPLINNIIISNGPVGGQTDSHGCLGPAGYSWNDSLGFCLREWELNDSNRQAAEIAIGPLSYYVTIIKVDTLNCSGCFNITIQRNDNRISSNIQLKDWKYYFPPNCDYNSSTKTYIKKDANCIINFLCTNDKKAFSDECGCGCEKILSQSECRNHTSTNCPSTCQVCPSCLTCDSVLCSSEEFCASIKLNYCTQEQKSAEVCPEYYSATCGWFNSSVKCLKYPCAQTFANPCFACANPNVEYYTTGECPK